ncbi:uncharacterized protein LOC110982306 [Acanthaster planci]|uniref:Uncharacterized protein LOC110982306 n=1 Tax=Acanthaster planci TaxID=133434 RepID=A0A8B7YSR4_ACAPL|nr:uncharacterized protein LOC110982306 [Acanthaster planci]XP_022096329.1 uncharacterized protein LOC110982306 [Acanthaster planci]XP_022096330.1 uncharacterized protein LOC110982306 [Acanthaster planci]
MSKPKEHVPSSQPMDKPRNVKGKNTASMSRRSAEANPLAQPVYHSTVALGHQLNNFQRMEFDAEGTVLKALEESEMARLNFAEKVAEAVNVPKKETKYSGLISVDVPVEATIAREVEDRMARLKTSHKQVSHKPCKASEVPSPNIMNAFPPDGLIVEEPIMDVPALTSQQVQPKPCSPEVAFDLYRHILCWDS